MKEIQLKSRFIQPQNCENNYCDYCIVTSLQMPKVLKVIKNEQQN